jgi:hypothetical protein
MPERCRADNVASVVARTRIVHVPAGPAGRDGRGQRGLGRAGKQSGSPLGASLFISRSGGRTVHGATVPAYVPGVAPSTCRCAGLALTF